MWWWEGSGPSVLVGGWKLISIDHKKRVKKKAKKREIGKAGELLKSNQALPLANSVSAYQSSGSLI